MEIEHFVETLQYISLISKSTIEVFHMKSEYSPCKLPTMVRENTFRTISRQTPIQRTLPLRDQVMLDSSVC
jgi:hypothetical protein